MRDGWHPRHFALLSDGSLKMLGQLIRIIESVGDFPSRTQDVAVALITDKRRPIGLYRALFRLWARLRRPLADEWEHQRAAQLFWIQGPGRACTDHVWRAAVQAATRAARQFAVAEIAYDIKKCYEHVPHVALARKACAAGYPARLLRVSIASYRWPRTISRGRLVTAPLYAQAHGIVAGNSFATSELKAYMVAALDAWTRRHAAVSLGVIVDDFAISFAHSDSRRVVGTLGLAAADLELVLTRDLALPIAAEKTTVVGNLQCAVTRLARRLGVTSKAAGPAVKKLGVDFSAGRAGARRSGATRTARLQGARTRLKRVRPFAKYEAAKGGGVGTPSSSSLELTPPPSTPRKPQASPRLHWRDSPVLRRRPCVSVDRARRARLLGPWGPAASPGTPAFMSAASWCAGTPKNGGTPPTRPPLGERRPSPRRRYMQLTPRHASCAPPRRGGGSSRTARWRWRCASARPLVGPRSRRRSSGAQETEA